MHNVAFTMLSLVFVVFWPTRASAYLNPDSGSILLQVLLGGAAGIAVAFKLLWHRIAALFARRPPGEPGAEQ